MTNSTFSILITTKNRKDDLAFTLAKIQSLLLNDDVKCIICDDGSSDGTAFFLQSHYPEIQLIQNIKSRGLIYSRNRLLDLVTTEFAISLDDDAHFISEKPLLFFKSHFDANLSCGLIALRIFWGARTPIDIVSNDDITRVQGFVGCGHVWRMKAWRDIPDYPNWFVFYGEEDFASYQLFKKKWQIHYLPTVLVHHRVDIKARKKNADYTIRLRRSLRAGWYLFFLFYPIRIIPRKLAYSIWMQLKLKVFKGDFKALQVLILALLDLVLKIPKIIKNSNRLSSEEYEEYLKISDTKIYWQSENTKNNK
jgi:glycosyltransferase involved in cell wall biosynthesis